MGELGRWAAAVGGGGDMRRRAANRFAVCSEDRRPIGAKPWVHGTFHWSRRFAAPMPAICERHVSRDLRSPPRLAHAGHLARWMPFARRGRHRRHAPFRPSRIPERLSPPIARVHVSSRRRYARAGPAYCCRGEAIGWRNTAQP